MSTPCPICGFDGRQVSPSDAAVALRSFPRRFKMVLAHPDDADRPDDVLHRRPKSGGLSAIEHAAWVATGIGAVADAFQAVSIHDDPVISLPPVDVDPPVAGGEDSVDAALARIQTATSALATAVEGTPGDSWLRHGHTDGESVTALEVVTTAVHLGVHHLRLADRVINEVARERD